MEANVEDLRDSFKIGYEAFEDSRKEANEVNEYYHNRQYTIDQLAILLERGQPAETFNVIKLFARMMVGYYSTVINTVTVTPQTYHDIDTAALLNDTVDYTFRDNRMDIVGDQIKLNGLLSGLLCAHVDVKKTDEKDQFGRPINRVVISYVPASELVLDPGSYKDDYSDASFIHRFKWLSEDRIRNTFGQDALDKLTAYWNFLNVDEADFEFNYGWEFTGHYRVFDNYLIVHSIIEDSKSRLWTCFWSDRHMLYKEEITNKEAKWSYRVQKVHSSDKKEYYGVFREVIESQKAVNQALLKLQLMVNSEKAYIEDGAVENIDDFTMAFNRVNGIVEVLDYSGIHIEKLSREVLDQYAIIDKSFDRIQRILGINDSFLGMAFASDSGRKVKLQQNASIMSLRYLTARIESFYKSLGLDVAHLVKQYYKAHQILRISDDINKERWIEINKPMQEFNGDVQNGEPQYSPILLPTETDGDFEVDDDDNIVLSPIPESNTEFTFTKFNVELDSAAYNDEDEKAQLMLETVLSGQIGQMTAKVNPAGFFEMSALSIRSMKTKYSHHISKILVDTGKMLQKQPEAQQGASEMAQGIAPGQPGSKALKLPQNTNEGVD